jgi:DegV family protein with EDD domain
MTAAVAVVTDSTACLTAELAAGGDIRIVPLRVVLHDRAADEDAPDEPDEAVPDEAVPDEGAPDEGALDQDVTVTIADVEQALRAGERVGTASPAPERFAAAYAAAAAGGAVAIVSVHLSGDLSGTVNSASLAAVSAPVPVRVVDSRSIGMGLGLAVRTAAAAARAGQDADAVAAAALSRAAGLRSYFALDTPGHLRAGGRLDPSPALPAAALTVRPLLHVRDGRIVLLEKARTPAGAIRRLEELAAGFAADQPVDLAIQYLGDAGRASAFAGRLARLVPRVRDLYLSAADAVICAHTGPGMLGVVVAPY